MLYNKIVVIDIQSGEIVAKDLPTIHEGPVELCDKKARSLAEGGAKTAAGTAAGYGSEASSIGSTLIPELTTEATHPTGFNPTDINAMLVGGQEGAGGAAGALSGEASTRAARSRNTGALSGVLDEIARAKTRAIGGQALGVQAMNAQEKERQRQAGLTGLERIRGGDVNAQLGGQKILGEDVNAMAEADKTGWGKDLMGWLDTLSGGATAAAKVKEAF